MPMNDGSKVKYGSAYGRGNVRMIFVDEIVEFVAEFSWSHKREKSFGYALNKAQGPVKQSFGKYVPGGVKFKGYKGGVQKMREKIAALSESGTCYGEVLFPIMLQFINSNEAPIDQVFNGCSWDEESSTVSDSADPLQDELAFTFWNTSINGVTLNDTSEEL